MKYLTSIFAQTKACFIALVKPRFILKIRANKLFKQASTLEKEIEIYGEHRHPYTNELDRKYVQELRDKAKALLNGA